MELGSTVFNSQIDALERGLVTEVQLRDNVRPLMYTRLRLGEFDPEDLNHYNAINTSVIQRRDHRELALMAALKSFVLLKNANGVLPLMRTYSKLAVSSSLLFVFLAHST